MRKMILRKHQHDSAGQSQRIRESDLFSCVYRQKHPGHKRAEKIEIVYKDDILCEQPCESEKAIVERHQHREIISFRSIRRAQSGIDPEVSSPDRILTDTEKVHVIFITKRTWSGCNIPLPAFIKNKKQEDSSSSSKTIFRCRSCRDPGSSEKKKQTMQHRRISQRFQNIQQSVYCSTAVTDFLNTDTAHLNVRPRLCFKLQDTAAAPFFCQEFRIDQGISGADDKGLLLFRVSRFRKRYFQPRIVFRSRGVKIQDQFIQCSVFKLERI